MLNGKCNTRSSTKSVTILILVRVTDSILIVSEKDKQRLNLWAHFCLISPKKCNGSFWLAIFKLSTSNSFSGWIRVFWIETIISTHILYLLIFCLSNRKFTPKFKEQREFWIQSLNFLFYGVNVMWIWILNLCQESDRLKPNFESYLI
jgi:hypothetical protein